MITEYFRPLTLDEAVALASHPDAVIIAGGTSVNADAGRSGANAVDLQALGLEGVESRNGTIRIGAMTLLQDLVESDLVPDVLRNLARREAPSTIRNAATIGGTIGAMDPESELLAGLLAYGAIVTLATADSMTDHSLNDILSDPGLIGRGIMTAVTAPSTGFAAADRTGRTPMDRPIVMAVAHVSAEGASPGSVRLAMTGVAPLPVIVDSERIDDLDPPSDFRGSSEYRRRLASVLAARVLTTVAGGEQA